MSKLRVSSFAVSIDGFGAGPNQDLQNPIGVGGVPLMEWFFPTRTWQHMHGHEGGETGVDDDIAAQGLAGIGAWILGRNMFGPVRGPWPDDSFRHLATNLCITWPAVARRMSFCAPVLHSRGDHVCQGCCRL